MRQERPGFGDKGRLLVAAHRLSRIQAPRRAAIALVALLLVTACASPASRQARQTAPDFPLHTYQGETILGGRETTFARVFEQGQPVVLNFWAGLCPPCRAEMPAFQRVADAYQGQVIVVGVDVGAMTGLGSRADARHLLTQLGIRYPAAAATDATPLQRYQVRSMPTTVFLSAEGVVVEQVSGLLTEAQLQAAVERLVQGTAAGLPQSSSARDAAEGR